MSATLIVLIPIMLLGVAALFGFTGCVLSRTGTEVPDPYDDLVISAGEVNLVAFWTLTDTSGTTATDAGPHHFNGTYNGNVIINQFPGIVPGDKVDGQLVDPCPLFNGGAVSVGFQSAINMAPPFTIEAWVMPGWSPNDPPALRGVVVSNSKSLGAGFGLFASPDNTWVFSLGIAAISIEVPAAGGPPIDFTQPTHLVVVYDKNLVCTIFVNNTPIAPVDTSTMGTYFPLNDINIPLFIGGGGYDPNNPSAPLFPFTGKIQCVAIYKVPLDPGTIQSHFQTGKGP